MHTDTSLPPIVTELEPLDPGPPRAAIISVCASKGGVGKSTLAANTAAWLGRPNPQRPNGLRVLVIDAEPQGHQAAKLGAPLPETVDYDFGDVADALAGARIDRGTGEYAALEDHFSEHPLSPTREPNVFLLRGGLTTHEARHLINGGGEEGEHWMTTVCEFFAPHFDVIVIDSPPVLSSMLGIGSVHAADLIVTPVDAAEELAIESLDTFIEALLPLGATVAPIVPVAMRARKRKLWKQIDEAVLQEGIDGYFVEAAALMQSVIDDEQKRLGPWLAVVPYDLEVSRQSQAATPIVTSRRSGSLGGSALRDAADRAYAVARSRVEAAA